MKVLRLHTLWLLLTALILLTATASCYNYDEDDVFNAAENHFINVTISVSVGENNTTRAPQGGEYGDGWEKGFDRENEVNNITLIFYQDDDSKGINTASDNSKVVCVKRYAVSRIDNTGDHHHKTTEPTTNYYDQEVLYTTGNQKLKETELEIGKSYKILVIANTFINAKVGDKIKDIRDQVISTVYEGTGVGTEAENFVMTSETDATVTLSNPTNDTSDGQNKKIYYFDCIHIERLAARIDFWAKTKDPGASYIAAEYDADTYDHAGYVYNVGLKEGPENKQDHFVLTSITPFNVMNGNEYYFKRTNDATNPYLADEVATGDNANWVLDPYTASKTSTTAHPDYLVSKLDDLKTLLDADNHLAPAYEIKTSTQQGVTDAIFDVTEGSVTADNIIIGYPKENTLIGGTTPLYYYATGLAFEGYYYKKDATKNSDNKYTGGTRKVFYHYLRHQGESDNAYSAHTNETLSTTATCPTSPAMNFGIVRNNIYRVSIESITPEDNDIKVKLLIKVKKWDKFVHAPIYM